ncbi:hypothetical protein DFH27DRAFT_569651 [Peziza echinospora]|nr:hypothetical protein DFH27DRAFT_569651 [Peziza echinospora]
MSLFSTFFSFYTIPQCSTGCLHAAATSRSSAPDMSAGAPCPHKGQLATWPLNTVSDSWIQNAYKKLAPKWIYLCLKHALRHETSPARKGLGRDYEVE